MHVVIINWKGGENAPFTYFNRVFAYYLEASGKRTATLEITDPDWPLQLLELKRKGVDYAISLQGIGSNTFLKDGKRSLWDELRIPLICLHGDHPCYTPELHTLESQYCAHVYWAREFSQYSNRHFRKKTGAIAIDPPLFYLDEPLGKKLGDHFVLLKNITPPEDIEAKWKQVHNGSALQLYLGAAEALRSHIIQQPAVDFHTVIDALVESSGVKEFDPQTAPASYHMLHRQLDSYVRNYKSSQILAQLKDIPLHVYGSGWQRYESSGNRNHRYFEGKDLADSQSLFYSRYGIVDVTPSTTGHHDRTLRAFRNETAFLSSAQLPDVHPGMKRFESLLYTFAGNDLREKCEKVIADPDAHAELSREFSHHYQVAHPTSELIWKFELLARSMRPW